MTSKSCEVPAVPDYKEMYLTLFRETAKAIALLQAAQQRTDALYLEADAGPLVVLSAATEDEPG